MIGLKRGSNTVMRLPLEITVQRCLLLRLKPKGCSTNDERGGWCTCGYLWQFPKQPCGAVETARKKSVLRLEAFFEDYSEKNEKKKNILVS